MMLHGCSDDVSFEIARPRRAELNPDFAKNKAATSLPGRQGSQNGRDGSFTRMLWAPGTVLFG
jgi:hypothetical protein